MGQRQTYNRLRSTDLSTMRSCTPHERAWSAVGVNPASARSAADSSTAHLISQPARLAVALLKLATLNKDCALFATSPAAFTGNCFTYHHQSCYHSMSEHSPADKVSFCPTCDKPFTASMTFKHPIQRMFALMFEKQHPLSTVMCRIAASRNYALESGVDRVVPAKPPR